MENPSEGFEKLLAMLPAEAKDFAGTEFAQPAAMAYFGARADVTRLRAKAATLRDADPARICELAMAMAEVIESNVPDGEKRFITDAHVRGFVFTGTKWTAGLAIIIGGADHARLVTKLKEKGFIVFAQKGAGLDCTDLGPRETAAVYAFQLMARYAMIWGQIKPGDAHEMGHFLEDDFPGFVVAHGHLTPVEELLLLGLMKMGAPAIVTEDYPFDLGRWTKTEDVDGVLREVEVLPNLRVREAEGESAGLPEFCSPANAKETFEPGGRIGGKNSFFVLMPNSRGGPMCPPVEDDLSRASEIGILVEVGDERLSVPMSKYVEDRAVGAIALLKGLRGERTDAGQFSIACAPGAKVLATQIAAAIVAGLRGLFPDMKDIRVKVSASPDEVAKLRANVDRFRAGRDAAIAEESDETAPCFYFCIECQPFSREHTCVISPDRPPMCNRGRSQVEAAAIFGAFWHPFKRRSVDDGALRGAVVPGEPLDAKAGEYASVNRAVEKLSGGRIRRVHLHSLRRYPHSNCGCFQFLAFWLESRQGIGVMERGWAGVAPEGRTWDSLANAAGGKQAPGIVGVSEVYLKSKRFLAGDGGHAAVRWASPKAFEAIKGLVPDPGKVEVGT